MLKGDRGNEPKRLHNYYRSTVHTLPREFSGLFIKIISGGFMNIKDQFGKDVQHTHIMVYGIAVWMMVGLFL